MALIKQLETFSYGRLSLKRGDFENFQKDRFSFSFYLLSFICILGQVSLILVSWSKLPPQVPLFYSRPWGEQMLARPVFLWILPVMALLAVGLNYFLTNFSKGDPFLKRVLVTFSFIISLTTLYTTVKIISLIA